MDTDLDQFDQEESDFERRLSILLNSHVKVVEKKYVQDAGGEIREEEENTDKRKRRQRRSSDKKRFVLALIFYSESEADLERALTSTKES